MRIVKKLYEGVVVWTMVGTGFALSAIGLGMKYIMEQPAPEQKKSSNKKRSA